MDVAPPNQHPATSDDELAKVLAGIGADDSAQHTTPQPGQSQVEAAGLQFEETPGPMAAPAGAANVNAPIVPPTPMPDPVAPSITPAPVAPLPAPSPAAAMPPMATGPVGDLDQLKKAALSELRPLVGKLNLSPKDRFDTLLLIIRSTDDQTLLEPAHDAARSIEDETERAQALLDVIKEIDYFSQPQQQPAAA